MNYLEKKYIPYVKCLSFRFKDAYKNAPIQLEMFNYKNNNYMLDIFSHFRC